MAERQDRPEEPLTPRTLLFVDASPEPGGATRVLLQILEMLDPAKATPLVACRAGSAVEEAVRSRGHEAVPLRMPTLTFAGGAAEWARMSIHSAEAVRDLSRILRQRRPALVHGSGLASTLIAGVPSALSRVPLVWHAHDMLDQRARHVPIIRAAGALSHSIVCVSRHSRDRLLRFGLSADKCRIVWNGVRVGPLPAGRPAGEAPSLLAVGALTPQKGQHVLVEALASLMPRYPGLRLDIVGQVLFDRDRAYEARLHAQVERLGLTGRVRFLGHRNDVPGLLRLATVVVHPATAEETFGLVPLEAMAAGRPVVASRIGGLSEVVEDGVTGRLVEPGRSDILARVLDELLGDPELRDRFGVAGHRTAAERFGLEGARLGLDEVFSSILGENVTRSLTAG